MIGRSLSAFGLGLVACVIVLGVGYRMATAPFDQAEPGDGGDGLELVSVEPVAASIPKISAGPETLARPVFSQTRRPVPEAPPAPAVASGEPAPEQAGPAAADLTLLGVFIRGDDRRALIRSPGEPAGVWLRTGDELEGWRVERVEVASVEIASEENAIALQLYVDNGAIH